MQRGSPAFWATLSQGHLLVLEEAAEKLSKAFGRLMRLGGQGSKALVNTQRLGFRPLGVNLEGWVSGKYRGPYKN